jgi:polysaccharide pyruvyl transferase WcaK-like protein
LKNINTSDCLACIDPALFAAELFKSLHENDKKENKIVAVNLREIDAHYLSQISTKDLLPPLTNLLNTIATQHEILLVPMHTFGIGGDDRYVLNRLARHINSSNIYVQNIPLNLEEIINTYFHAVFCIGMRFHSVLLQTILNGKNYILDYTNPQNGKIINFLYQIKAFDFYKYRYYSLTSLDKEFFNPSTDVVKYLINPIQICDFRKVYIENLNRLFL